MAEVPFPSVLDIGVRDWDRQRDEPPAAWFAFRRYRDGQRVLTQLADELEVPRPTVYAWARDWSWKSRALAWDRYVDQKAQAEIVSEDTARVTHLATASRLRHLGLSALQRLLDELQADGKVVSASAVVRALAEAVRIERLVLGQATEIVRDEGPDYSKLSDEDFETLVQIQKKLSNGET